LGKSLAKARGQRAGAPDGTVLVGSDGGKLELNGLSRRYGNVVALDGLSFTVPPGQVFGFLGPNGAGKPVTGL
jgi:ABC-type uncharacterized transport system ATPase subunit